jgi:hypothetical protein
LEAHRRNMRMHKTSRIFSIAISNPNQNDATTWL